jgi:predicted aspartyl protease
MSVEVSWQRSPRRILLPVQVLPPEPAHDLTGRSATALLDTGATTSGVARGIARSLDLPSIGKEPINTAGGTILSERYLFRLGIPRPGAFPYIFDDVTGFELSDGSSFDALLGMGVLARCDVILLRDGSCTLRFG